ncbi:MAG: hypothetical protein ACE5JI_17300 [Acidobacteriota bacterium]
MPQTVSMSDDPLVQSATYTCAVCNAEMERDLLVFLRHTDQHILEALKDHRPEWADSDADGSHVLELYRSQLGHDPW